MTPACSMNDEKRGRPVVLSMDERRQKILCALNTVFAREGMAGTTMNAIAAEAGMSKSTLYRLFADRDALFMAYFEMLRASFVHPLTENDKQLPLAERLRKLLEPRPMAYSSGLPIAVVRHIISQVETNPELGKTCLFDILQADRVLIRDELDLGVARKEISISDTDSAAMMLQSMVHFPILDLLLVPDLRPKFEDIRARFELGMNVFLNGIHANRSHDACSGSGADCAESV